MKRQAVCTAFVALVAVSLIGCGRDWKAEIESNTSWYGAYGGVSGSEWTTTSVQGSGDRTIDLPDDDRVCCRFYQEGNGFLSVKVKDDGGGLFHIFAEDSRQAETNINGGMIEICTEGSVPGY